MNSEPKIQLTVTMKLNNGEVATYVTGPSGNEAAARELRRILEGDAIAWLEKLAAEKGGGDG